MKNWYACFMLEYSKSSPVFSFFCCASFMD